MKRNDEGFSLPFAMVVFIAVSVFCLAIITASLNTSVGAISQRQHEQAYLTTASAARLVRDALTGGSVTVVDADSYTPSTGDAFLAAAAALAGDMSGEQTLTVTVPDLASVTVKLTMAADYSITAELSVDDPFYAMEMQFASQRTSETTTTYADDGSGSLTETTSTATVVTWAAESVGK